MTKVSIVICTWNRAHSLDRVLAKVSELDVPRGVSFDVHVINNNCTDGTSSIIAKWREALDVAEWREPRQGVAFARNMGLDHATGDLLVFLDDDVMVERGWLKAYVDAANRWPHADFFGGDVKVATEKPVPRAFREFLAHLRGLFEHPIDRDDIVGTQIPFTLNLALRRAAIGGMRFDTSLGLKGKVRTVGEDTAFVNAMRRRHMRGKWVRESIAWHIITADRFTWIHVWRTQIGAGRQALLDLQLNIPRRWRGIPTPLFLVLRIPFHALRCAASLPFLHLRFRAISSLAWSCGVLQEFWRDPGLLSDKRGVLAPPYGRA